MIDKLREAKLEKRTKLKYLASALFICTSLERKVDINRVKNAIA